MSRGGWQRRLAWTTLGVVVLAGVLGAALLLRRPPALPELDGGLAEEAHALPGFSLAGSRGPVTERDLHGRWHWLFFGYTHCPDACPTTLAALSEVSQRLGQAGAEAPQVVFISVDPARDSPALVDAYLGALSPGALGAVGDDAALAPLTGYLGVFHRANPPAGKEGDYTVDHTATVFLVDGEGRLRASFPPPQQPATLATDYLHLRRAEG